MVRRPQQRATALSAITRVLSVLETLPRHKRSQLFFRLYESNTKTEKRVLDEDVSSVDNMHLALGLWTLAERLHNDPDPIARKLAERADRLFQGMDFSLFYDPHSGLVGGNLKRGLDPSNPKWTLEEYRYHFGSEARSVYLLGYAFGLFKKYPLSALESALSKVPVEMASHRGRQHMQVWDAGIFQALLPKLLLNEERYSDFLGASLATVGRYVLLGGPAVEGRDGSFPLPAGYSACVTDVKKSSDGKLDISYTGKAGFSPLKVSSNTDPVQEDVVAMHAVLLAATLFPMLYAPRLERTEQIDGGGNQLYLPGFGWVDSIRFVTGKNGKAEARPNSAGVGIDKAIELLALLQMLEPDGLGESGRALAENETANRRLSRAYEVMERRQQQTTRAMAQ